MGEKQAVNRQKGPGSLIGGLLLIAAILGGIGLIWVWRNLPVTSDEDATVPTPEVVQVEPTAVSSTVPPTTSPTPIVPPTTTAVPTSTTPPIPSPTPMPLPDLDNALDENMAELATLWFADFIPLTTDNAGIWAYQTGNFIHPIALEIGGDKAYLLDTGRILTIDITQPTPPELLLSAGDLVEDVPVLEPIDLAVMGDFLVVLDRAGDVYRYEISTDEWRLDRYDRPVEASSGHYFLALDAPGGIASDHPTAYVRSLLETNYKFVLQYGQETTPLWNLPEARGVDVSAYGEYVYVLQRELHEPTANVSLYQDTRHIETFVPRLPMERPLQMVATETAVYVLDQSGRRLLALDPRSGTLLRIYQLPQGETVSVFWADPTGQQLIFAGKDRLYFLDQPERLAAIPGGDIVADVTPNDPQFLSSLTNFNVPIGGSNITFRDFQLPGAPRHYRLGVHNGLDFYWQPGTDILAAGDGVVIRADIEYTPPTATQLGLWWADSQERGYTADDILDHYLGRQVWIEHSDGLISRYAHLSSINPGIGEGITVKRGQKIGEVGNSGSPASLEGPTADAHLHFELWIGEHYLGQYLRPIETRAWIEQIFGR